MEKAPENGSVLCNIVDSCVSLSAAVPRFKGDLNHSKHNTGRSKETFSYLPILFVALDPPLQFRDTPTVAVAQYWVLVVPSLK
jgi:hypothetical protein